MQELTDEGRSLVARMVHQHGVGADAVVALMAALQRGGGWQAQFSHPDLGGMGQWSRGGMIMIGDMFNQSLKARVDQLCNDLSDAMARTPCFMAGPGTAGQHSWWPPEFGAPTSSGSQNDMRYACFPDRHRLVVLHDGALRIYDTGAHRISGVSQQQGGGQDLSFTSQLGTVRLHDLRNVEEPHATQADAPVREAFGADRMFDRAGEVGVSGSNLVAGFPAQADAANASSDDIFAKIERLHDLMRRNILSEAEFTETKKELLARL